MPWSRPPNRHLPGRSWLPAILLALTAVTTAGAGTTSAATFWVDDDGTVGARSCDGTKRVPRRIQDTFERIINTLGPDKLIICPGTYLGPIVLAGEMNSIEIRGTRPGVVRIIRPPGRGFDAKGSVFEIIKEIHSATVRDLVITVPKRGRCRSDSLVDITGHNIRFMHNKVIGRADCVGTAIRVRMDNGRSDAYLRDNTIRDFWTTGIEVAGYSAYAAIRDNTVRVDMRGSTVPRRITGVVFRDDADGFAFGNEISARNGPALRDRRPTLEVGVLLADLTEDQPSVSVVENRIQGAWSGIRLERVTQHSLTRRRVERNAIVGSGHAGIELELTTDTEVRDNDVSSDTGTGILMVDSGPLSGQNAFISNLIADNPVPCIDPGNLNAWSANDATCLWGS